MTAEIVIRKLTDEGVEAFQVRGKLAQRFIAYRLELPLQHSAVHDVFYMSQLEKSLRVSK